jgi:hypothetical protein
MRMVRVSTSRAARWVITLQPPAGVREQPKPKLAVEGPGGVQASLDFSGAKNDAAGRMLTITLTNDLDGVVYA